MEGIKKLLMIGAVGAGVIASTEKGRKMTTDLYKGCSGNVTAVLSETPERKRWNFIKDNDLLSYIQDKPDLMNPDITSEEDFKKAIEDVLYEHAINLEEQYKRPFEETNTVLKSQLARLKTNSF